MGDKKPIIVTIVLSVIILIGLGFYDNMRGANSADLVLDEESEIKLEGPLTAEEQEVTNPVNTNTMNPTAILTTNKGVIEIELYEDLMPVTAGNFVQLAESGFYDNVKFHRVIDGFMIQSGDPNSKSDNEMTYGTGGSDNIPDEFVDNEILTNTRGSIAMANTGQPNSGSSQFFINLGDNSPLDFNDDRQPMSKHPVFGRVKNGMDVVDAIAKVSTKERDIPVEPVVIESVTISRN